MTAAAKNLNEFAREHEIGVSFEPAESNPYAPGNKSGLKHYTCRLVRRINGGESKGFSFPFSAMEDPQPFPAWTLFALANDRRIAKMPYPEFVAWCGNLLDGNEIADYRAAFEAQTKRFEKWLGPLLPEFEEAFRNG